MMAAWLECFTLALREQRSAPHAGCVSGTSRYGPNIPLCNGYVQTAAVNGVRTETADVARGSGGKMSLCVHRYRYVLISPEQNGLSGDQRQASRSSLSPKRHLRKWQTCV